MAQVRIRKRGKTFSYIFEAGKKSEGKRKVVEKGGLTTKNWRMMQELPHIMTGNTTISELSAKILRSKIL